MSHFKLLVVGENIDEQLAPYDENLTTEPRVDTNWDYQSDLENARKFYTNHPESLPKQPGGEPHTLSTISDLDLVRDYNEGEDIREEAGTVVRYTTYNPKSKWDYWVIGGRYNANFKILPGASEDDFLPSAHHWSEGFGNVADHINAADQARKSAIDWQAMKDVAIASGEKLWSELENATKGLTPPELSWEQTREKHGEDIEAARQEWNTHPWNKAAREARLWEAYDFFKIGEPDPRAAFIAYQELMATTGFYAILNNGEWISQGDMGWFGFSTDHVSEEDWRAKVKEFIDGLPADALLTVVDCHI